MDEKIRSLIEEKQNFLIILSIADEDSLSSGIILKHILSSIGKNVKAIHYSPIPERFSYIPYVTEVEIEHPSFVDYSKYDAVITIDAGSIKQLMDGASADKFSFPDDIETICIDHHSGNTKYAKHYIYDAEASSTAELIYAHFMQPLEGSLPYVRYEANKDEATLLLIGIVGDTGFFKFALNSKILSMTQYLLSRGADNFYVTNYLYYNKDFRLHKFLTYSISKIEFFPTIKFMLLTLNLQDVKNMGLDINDVHQFTRPYHELFTNAYKGYDYGGILIEGENGDVIGSFRGNPYANKVDLASFCKLMTKNGGGHFHSAGFLLQNAEINESKKNVLEALTDMYYGKAL